MTRTSWDRVAELFHDVVDLPPDEQEARIAAGAGDDAALRAEVRDLIRAARLSGRSTFIVDAIAATAAELTDRPLSRTRR